MFDFLKKVPLFADLPDEDLNRLCKEVKEETLSAGEILFTEGEMGQDAYVIMEGEIDILKESGGRTVLLGTRRAGDMIGEMSLLDLAPRSASGRARTDCRLLTISHQNLEHLLDANPSAARVLLATITNRLQSTELVLRESEKMAQLGTLTAGIAHELNNPASAARRGSEYLRSSIDNFQQLFRQFHAMELTNEQWMTASEYHDRARERASEPVDLDSLRRSDLEEEIERWLESRDIEDRWEKAAILVNLGVETADLEKMELDFPGPQLAAALQWICTFSTIYSLLEEIHQGTTRIGEIVKSLKSYVYLDQAPVQLIDIHEGLDNTLVMLRSKLKPGITVERNYAQDLPRIMAYGGELNQVWTNIIDNAIDAMGGEGAIVISTRQEDDWVYVEIEDTGPGIPDDIRQILFSPFFTTKRMGKGTGLGLSISLNIVQKHSGYIHVFSRPGRTCFSVRLPVNFEQVAKGLTPLSVTDQIPDAHLLEILEATETIAVVGISQNEGTPSYNISRYLIEQGYSILPINPKYDRVLGEKAYPDLLALEHSPDVVLVFRRSDYVPEIVEQAIEIGAKVVWLQEGIINPTAAETARDAGIDMIMDTCIRKTHQRLVLRQ